MAESLGDILRREMDRQEIEEQRKNPLEKTLPEIVEEMQDELNEIEQSLPSLHGPEYAEAMRRYSAIHRYFVPLALLRYKED